MNRESIDWTRLARYLAGETPPEEAAEIRRWLEEHRSDAEVIAALDAATAHLSPSRAVDVEQALLRVKAQARADRQTAPWRIPAVAAAAVVAIALGIFAWGRTRAPEAPATTAYQTAIGMTDTVRLADGSIVYLAPASRLVVSGREAELQGEAYFEVVHDARTPFTVRAGSVVIRDVGTRFAVHGLPGSAVRVVVNEGAVSVERSRDSVVLRGGDVAVVQPGRIATSRGTATADDIAWMEGRLVFRDAPLAQVAADLRRWYGVELLVPDSALRQRHFTGSFVKEPATRVVQVIAMAMGARVQLRGDTAILGNSAPPR